ncbi:MAG: non-heme iron oxygenase ferredoxin subunit [Flavobacteriaceae bacterium]
MNDGWTRVARVDDVPESEDATVVAVDGEPVALFHVEGAFYAIDDRCPHEKAARLSDGYLDGMSIECPMHQACFDIRSGKVLSPPAKEDVGCYDVQVSDGQILLRKRSI